MLQGLFGRLSGVATKETGLVTHCKILRQALDPLDYARNAACGDAIPPTQAMQRVAADRRNATIAGATEARRGG